MNARGPFDTRVKGRGEAGRLEALVVFENRCCCLDDVRVLELFESFHHGGKELVLGCWLVIYKKKTSAFSKVIIILERVILIGVGDPGFGFTSNLVGSLLGNLIFSVNKRYREEGYKHQHLPH